MDKVLQKNSQITIPKNHVFIRTLHKELHDIID